jgi:hypothetical protein
VFGDHDEKLHAQERLARLKQTKSASLYAMQFRQNSLRAEINDEGLMQLFYDVRPIDGRIIKGWRGLRFVGLQ